MSKLKWTIKGRKEVVYTGTLKAMVMFTGEAALYNGDGTLYGKGHCENGIKVGPWQYFHAAGQLRRDARFDEKGQLHGEMVSFAENGVVTDRSYYQHGRPIGESLSYYPSGVVQSQNQYDEKGKSKLIESFYPDGTRRYYAELVAGLLSKECYYKKDGSLWQETLLDRGRAVTTRKFD